VAQQADNSLEARFAALEAQVRSLRATNLTDLASVVDASGHPVPLSSLAFGQVADIWAGVGVMNVSGVLNQASGANTDPAAWTYTDRPTVTVLVRGGRLRVDWSALIALNGGNPSTSFAASWAYSYRVTYTGPQDSPGSVSTIVAQPDYYRAIMVRDTSPTGTGSYVEMGNWAMHTGLAPGWYAVQAAWRLQFASAASGSPPQAFADNPRIAATPL
jgi:hypothetical protein